MAKQTVYELIRDNRDLILKGTLLSVDPSCGSKSSDPAFALFKKNKLVENDIYKLDKKKDIHTRVRQLHDLVESSHGKVDVLVIEKIRKGHTYLRWSVPAIFLGCRAPLIIEIAPISWQRFIDKSYVKSDKADAYWIGKAVLKIAKENK